MSENQKPTADLNQTIILFYLSTTLICYATKFKSCTKNIFVTLCSKISLCNLQNLQLSMLLLKLTAFYKYYLQTRLCHSILAAFQQYSVYSNDMWNSALFFDDLGNFGKAFSQMYIKNIFVSAIWSNKNEVANFYSIYNINDYNISYR